MDRRHMVWPITDTGERLATLLREAGFRLSNGMNGSPAQIVDHYLGWVGDQVRMLQGSLAPHDLNRLLTTPRYWATLANSDATRITAIAVQQEAEHVARILHASADAVAREVEAWAPHDGAFTNLLLPDTNFWVNVSENLGTLDWHAVLAENPGPSHPTMQDEVRIVVPLLVIDELDALTHRREMRPKVGGVVKYLYGLLGDRPGIARQIRPEAVDRGQITMQLLFEPLGHIRLPNSDDELVERLVVLRDFLGHPAPQTFFVTHDGGAGFRATNAGLMTRLLPTPTR